MRTFAVTYDLLLEASKRKWFLALGIAITLVLAFLCATLKLDVVDGALAATRFFGKLVPSSIQSVDVALRPIFAFGTYVIFYGGMAFGVFACADFAPSLLSPGRIEHLLALPLRRYELLLGTFLGVLTLSLLGALYGAAGLTVVLGIKTGVWTARPALAAALAGVGFTTLYAAMLVTTLYVRSAAVSVSAGVLLFILGMISSYRADLVRLFSAGLGRDAFAFLTLLVPPIGTLGKAAAELASSPRNAAGTIGQLLLGFVVFTAAVLAVGIYRFEQKDF